MTPPPWPDGRGRARISGMNSNRVRLQAAMILALCAASFSAGAAAPDPALDYPEERGVDAGERWREKLGLDAEQVRKLTSLENEKDARLKPLRELLRNGMIQLQAQLAEGGAEPVVQDILKQILDTRRVITERAEEYDARRAEFLSPSQLARLLVWESLGGLDGYAARRLEAASRRERREEEHEKEN